MKIPLLFTRGKTPFILHNQKAKSISWPVRKYISATTIFLVVLLRSVLLFAFLYFG